MAMNLNASLAPDLTRDQPRPMDATLEGYAWLPRIIDKARAARAGTLGSYVHPCPVDRRCLKLLGLDAQTFGDVVERSGSDKEILEGLRALGIPSAQEAWFDAPAFEAQLMARMRRGRREAA
jgi:hypothetical protein